jgi:hypothetical protein
MVAEATAYKTRGTMKEDQESAVIACSLEEADLADRRDRWRQLGERAGVDVLTSENGLRLLFRAAPGVEGELRRLAELEQACCAFADWSVRDPGEEVVLDVTADSDEGIAAVQAMFNKLR